MDTKELIRKCTHMLNQRQQMENEGNMAKSPVILLFFGEVTYSHMQHVKNTLDTNFQNGAFLQYLYLYLENDICCAKNISTGEIYESVEMAIEHASLDLLETEPAVFRSKNVIYFECLLSSTEDYAERYYEEYLQLKESHNYNPVKTLYLMLDQRSRACEKQAQCLIDRIRKDEEERGIHSNIYLLSNMLGDGSILGAGRIWQNYRIVADLILLGNTFGASGKMEEGRVGAYSNMVHDGIMTVAYSFVGKPLDDITKVSLYHLMKKMYEREETAVEELGADELTERFKSKLKGDDSDTNLLIEIFQKRFQGKLPDIENFQWLPWKEKKGYTRFVRKDISDWEQINNMTCGVLELYYQTQYENVLLDEVSTSVFTEVCRKQIHDFLGEKFSFFELARNLENDYWRTALRDALVLKITAEQGKWLEVIGKQAENRLKKKFYQWAAQILEDELERIYEQISRTKKSYLDVLEEVRKARFNFENENNHMDHFYENEVAQFLLSDSVPELFRTESTLDGILQQVCQIFEQLIEQRSIYGEPFEKEEVQRLKNVSELERSKIMKKRLSEDVSNQKRLYLDYIDKEECVGTFCMVSARSVYMEELKVDEKCGRFALFDLNRRDCLEMLELYKLEDLRQIILGR